MTANDILRAFQFNQLTLTRNLEDVSQEESLAVPRGAENSINWILGHIIGTRAQAIRFMGGEPHWNDDRIDLYAPGKRERFEQEPMSLAELKSALSDSLGILEKTLETFAPRLDESTGRQPMFGDVETALHRTLFLACHEAYHAGQIGLTRRLLGKPGQF
ncbi:DinB family protein [bacterium]|nr:DinB family protein [bacterium]MBU1984740.1 DinB family protein [bacterium]